MGNDDVVFMPSGANAVTGAAVRPWLDAFLPIKSMSWSGAQISESGQMASGVRARRDTAAGPPQPSASFTLPQVKGEGESMRTFVSLIGCTALVMFGCTPGSQPETVDDVTAATEVRAAMDAYVAAIRANDAEAVSAAWADDLVYIHAGAPAVRGRAELDAMVRASFADRRVTSVSADVEEVSVSGDMGYSLGSYSESLMLDSGDTETLEGRVLVIWRRQADGAWKIARMVGD